MERPLARSLRVKREIFAPYASLRERALRQPTSRLGSLRAAMPAFLYV